MMEFEVNLICANWKQTPDDWVQLKDNCTHIEGRYWFYEGDIDCLQANFVVFDTGVVPSLGGLSSHELLKICDSVFPGWVRPC